MLCFGRIDGEDRWGGSAKEEDGEDDGEDDGEVDGRVDGVVEARSEFATSPQPPPKICSGTQGQLSAGLQDGTKPSEKKKKKLACHSLCEGLAIYSWVKVAGQREGGE